MQLNQIIESLNSIHSGSFHKVIFKSELPTKAIYKKSGIKVIKITEMIMRTGIDYKTIAPKKEESSNNRTNNYHSIIKNKLLFNTNTNKYYARVYPYSNVKSAYYVVKGIHMEPVNDISEYVINSYLNSKSSDGPIVLNVNIDNIISL